MTVHRTTLIEDLPALQRLSDEWERLFESSAVSNPFAHPEWLTCWAEHFVGPQQLRVICTHRDDELVGVAPFYREAGRFSGTRLRLLGAGRDSGLLDLPQVLAAPGEERRVLRSTAQCLLRDADRWDWVELLVAPEQGWFEQEWLPHEGAGGGAFALHLGGEACVVCSLEGGWEGVRSRLKPSAREAIRRSRRAFERDGHAWRVEFAGADDGSLRALLDLHRARAGDAGHASRGDYLADERRRDFFEDVAARQSRRGQFTVALLYAGDTPVAGTALAHANETLYLSLTGFDPRWWEHSPLTLLQAECLRLCADQGARRANLGYPPTVARLRWSETIEQHNRFVLVGPRRRSRRAYRVYALTRLAAQLGRLGRNPGIPSLPTEEPRHLAPTGRPKTPTPPKLSEARHP